MTDSADCLRSPIAVPKNGWDPTFGGSIALWQWIAADGRVEVSG
jgi:hypothetical protein